MGKGRDAKMAGWIIEIIQIRGDGLNFPLAEGKR